MITIGIDPGFKGAAVCIEPDIMEILSVHRITESDDYLSRISKWFDDIEAEYGVEPDIFMEKTGGYRPGTGAPCESCGLVRGQSGPAAVKFARHCGALEGLLIGSGRPFVPVAPVSWQRRAVANTGRRLPPDYGERKRALKDHAGVLFPGYTFTLIDADAALLAYYGA